MKKERIAIIGLGYVGLPLSVAFAEKQLDVVGFDIKSDRIKELKNGYDRTDEITQQQLENIAHCIKYTDNEDDLANCTIFIVTVPTPIDKENKPNLKPLISSTELIARSLKKDDLVIYESTVYPGMTEEVCIPILEEKTALKLNKDFYAGYSPERINPGDKKQQLKDILKLTSGSNEKTAQTVDALYRKIITQTHKTNSIKIAEEMML